MATFPGSPPNPLGFKAELNLAGSWTDITAFVMLRNQVQITGMGRADESSSISASQLTLTLKNGDGRFTPKNASGAYSPNILRNTQIRVSVNATSSTSVAYNQFRFFGEIAAWPPATDVSGRDNSVSITANGIWRRISQSSVTIGSPYSRYVEQLTGTSIPAGYWPMEDGSGSTVLVSDIGAGGNAAVTAGTPSFSADGTSFGGSDALMQFNNARITAPVSGGGTATNNVIRFALSVPSGGDSNAAGGNWNVVQVNTAGTLATIECYLLGTGKLQFDGVNSGGTILFTVSTTTNVKATPVLVSMEVTPSGSSVNWALRIIKPGAGTVLESQTGTHTAVTIGAVTSVTLNRSGTLSDTTFGQLGVWYTVPTLTTAAAALGGFAGEFAVVRFQRLCAEFSIPTTVIGSTSAAMGPQADDTLANILQSIEDTDGGLLYETRDQFGLGYRTLISLQNQSVAVTLSATGKQIDPPAPTYDDQLVKNQWTVTNTSGYVAQATLTSGAVSVQQVPNGIGVYSGTANCNASTAAQVNAIAQQRLFVGTVDDVRYPTVTVNMARLGVAALFSSLPSTRIGDYLQITNLPATIGGSATAKQLAWGYAETFGGDPEGWAITFNAVPEAPFETAFSPGVFSVVQAPTQGVALGGAVGSSVSGSQLAAGAVGSGALSGTISARSVGGVTSFISAATPYDWSFAVSGTPADVTYFTCTEDQAVAIYVGDTFTNSGGLGGPFTVTSLDPPSGGNVNIHFQPNASGVMSTGTVSGGKNGDTWVNLSGGNQVNQWSAGAWVPVVFGPTATGNTGAVQNDNPYFTAGDPTGWSGFNGTFAVTGSPPAGASYPYAGVYVNNGVTAGAMEEGDTNGSGFAVTAATQISITGWFRSTSTTIQIGFDYATAAFGFVAGPANQNFTVAANTWVQLTAVQTVPATAAWARPRIGCSTANSSTTYAQAVTCSQQVPGTLITAGTITGNQILANTITAGLLAAGSVIAGTIAAGAIDGMTITGATIIADGTSGEVLIYSGTPSSSNLIAAISGAAGTDAFSTAYAKGIEVKQGGLILDSQGSAPGAVTGASTIYTSSLGRLRYASSSGADMVLDRSALNSGNFTMTTQTSPVVMSGALLYLAGEASVGSEYEIEIDGTITTPTATGIPYTFSLFSDGALFGSLTSVAFGSVMLVNGQTFGYTLRYRVTVDTTGAGGTATCVADGGISRQGVNLGNVQAGGGLTTSAINRVDTSQAWDTTANHTLALYGFWTGSPASGSAITYQTRITRRN